MTGNMVARLLTSLLVVTGSSMLVFFIMYILPGDPVLQMLDGNATTPEAIAELRHELGLDRRFHEQFFDYFSRLLQGDFGQSRINKDPVLPKILKHAPATLMLTLVSTIFSVVIGILLNGMIDFMARFVGLFGISMPAFWTGKGNDFLNVLREMHRWGMEWKEKPGEPKPAAERQTIASG